MEEKRTFGEYIQKKRRAAQLTQRELADMLYVTESTVSKWERGLSYPDVSMVTAICGALGISEHEFFTACDDDRARAQAREAKNWRRVTRGLRCFFALSYGVALLACFICDLAIFHTLDWFWIVLTSLALSFCFTNLPFRVRRNRLPVCLGAASGCLLLVLLSCWLYVGDWWIIGGMFITAACLALPWAWWAVWRFYGRHIVPLCAVLFSGWLFVLLTVVRLFDGGDWLLSVAFPIAAVCLVFVWVCLAICRWLPVGRWLKAGLTAVLLSFMSPVINCMCDRLIENRRNMRFLDYFNPLAVLERRDPDWVNALTAQLMLLCALVLVVVGAVMEVRRRRDKK